MEVEKLSVFHINWNVIFRFMHVIYFTAHITFVCTAYGKAIVWRTHLGIPNLEWGGFSLHVLEWGNILEKNLVRYWCTLYTACFHYLWTVCSVTIYLMLLSRAGMILCFRWINHALSDWVVLALAWTHHLCFCSDLFLSVVAEPIFCKQFPA